MKTLTISILIAAAAVAAVLVGATNAKALPCRGQYKAQYYKSITLTNLGETRCEAAPLDRDYGSGPISPLSHTDNVSARWTGTFDFEAANYEFYARADDGVRLYVDGSLLIDEWRDQGATAFKRTKALSAGRHQIKVEWYEKTGDAVIKVNWTRVTPQPPPPPPSDCPRGQYLATYRNEEAARAFTTAPLLTRCESAPLAYDLGLSSPAPEVNAEDYTAVWKGDFDFEAADYTFSARADDGVRVYLDGALIIDQWRDQSATDFRATSNLTAGTHVVKVEYYENTTDSVAKLSWAKASVPPPPPPLPSGAEFGVNLAGAEFGDDALPGVHGRDYIYPNAQELDYYHSKGQDVIRLPFRWERVQPTLNGPLSSAEAGRIDAVVQAAEQRNMKVILDVHNYGRYKTPSGELLLGSAALPNSAFADLWRKLAARYASSGGIYGYGLMNEPHDLGGDGRWPAAAQAAVNAIRQVDSTHAIFVSGDHWSGAQSWTSTSNANLAINDPAGKLVYEAHSYWDNDHSGDYALGYSGEGLTANAGVEDLSPFVGWCEQHGHKCFIGEFGVPRQDVRYMTTLDNALAYMRDHGISGTYWAGGPWWGEYNLTIEPADLSNPVDRPQMDVLERY